MSIWLKVRKIWPTLSVLGGTAGVLALLGGVAIPVPGLLSLHGVAVPIALLAPLALSTVLAFALTAGDEVLESASSRRLGLLDVALVGGITTMSLLIFTVVTMVGATELGAAAGRNACGYVGLMLLGARFVSGYAASLVPSGFAVLTAIFGGSAAGEPRWWAWLLADATDLHSWLLALGLLLLGSVLWLSRPSPLLRS